MIAFLLPIKLSLRGGKQMNEQNKLELNYQPEVIVDTTTLSEQEWLEYRKQGIGGSDIPAVMGQSPFCTARDLYYEKIDISSTNNTEKEENNWVAKEVGHRLEDLVAEMFSKRIGLKVYPIKKMFCHPKHPFMIANIDFLIDFPDGKKGILECKTTNYNCKEKWDNDTVPFNYELQCRHYMSVMNINVAYIACLYGNSENEFIIRKIERDLELEEALIAEEQYFWEEYVQKKIKPPYTEKADLVLKSLQKYASSIETNKPIVLPADSKETIGKYLKLKEEKSKLDKQSKKIEEEMKQTYSVLVELLGTNSNAILTEKETEYLISYNPVYRTGINKEKLELLKLQYPDIYNAYVETTESRRFNIKVKAKPTKVA